MKNNKGFTLTELLAVIVIIAILSVAAISGYSTMTRNSKKKTYESKVQSIENAAIKFANDSNLNTSTTISVNKLVVEGYLQPDESTETGLASILNPLNNENMICNLIRITVNDDIYIAEYKENKKDCLIAEQEMLDLEINIKAKELNGNTIGNNIAIINNITNWTRTDVLLTVSSEEYTDFNSISYDFDGRTITKDKNTPLSTSTNYIDTDYDKIAIKDVLIMFNNEVTVTYNMNDGTTHSRTIVVRIDKEIPTARAVVSNDVSTSSTRKVSLTLDDANGSGVKGFYVSKSSDFTGKPLIKDTSDKDSKEAGHGSFAGYNSHFYGEQGTYYIKVIDKVGNEYITEKIELSNFDPNANSCKITVDPIVAPAPTYWTEDTEWYNKDIKVTTTSNNDIGSMGLKYFYGIVNVGTNITNEKKLTEFFRPEGSNTKLIKSLNQSNESDLRDYYTAMKGLSNKTKDITHCKKTIGVDKTKPTATISCTDCDTIKRTHTITISVTDAISGFSDNSIKIGWSPNRTTAPTSWLDLNGTISADKKSVSFTTDANKTTGDPLTGEYYLWVQGESIADKAYNYLNNTSTTYKIKYDNTYTIVYNGNYNDHGSMANTSCTYDKKCKLRPNAFTRYGYTFEKWNTKADGTGTNYNNEEEVLNLTTTAGGTVNLYAIWHENYWAIDSPEGGADTLKDALDKANAGATLKLMYSYEDTYNNEMDTERNVNINLNGKTATMLWRLKIHNNVNIVGNEGVYKSKHSCFSLDGGNTVINGGKYITEGDTSHVVMIDTGAHLTVRNSIFTTSTVKGHSTILMDGGRAVIVDTKVSSTSSDPTCLTLRGDGQILFKGSSTCEAPGGQAMFVNMTSNGFLHILSGVKVTASSNHSAVGFNPISVGTFCLSPYATLEGKNGYSLNGANVSMPELTDEKCKKNGGY